MSPAVVSVGHVATGGFRFCVGFGLLYCIGLQCCLGGFVIETSFLVRRVEVGSKVCDSFVYFGLDVPLVNRLREDAAVCEYLDEFSDVRLVRNWVSSCQG